MNTTDKYISDNRTRAYSEVGSLISYLKFTYFRNTEGTGNIPKKEYAEEVIKRMNPLISDIVWFTPELEQVLRAKE